MVPMPTFLELPRNVTVPICDPPYRLCRLIVVSLVSSPADIGLVLWTAFDRNTTRRGTASADPQAGTVKTAGTANSALSLVPPL
jgi:hypothetical protein